MTSNEELNKLVRESVKELMAASTEVYEGIKLVLLSCSQDNEAVHSYVCRLFSFTDAHRPLLIEMKSKKPGGRMKGGD